MEGIEHQSPGYETLEGARLERDLEWWGDKKPSIVRIETTETLMEEGDA